MFTFQALVKQGLKFSGYLYKDSKPIGGIGNSEDGIYVRLREKLTVSEMKELMSFVDGLYHEFKNYEFDLTFIKETPKQDEIEVIKEKNGVPTVIKYNGRRYVLDNRN